jgi:hypothetical protein
MNRENKFWLIRHAAAAGVIFFHAFPTTGGPYLSGSEPLDLITLPPIMVDYYASSTRVSHQKAIERLGYRPQYDLASGMALVRGWAEWARLV